MIRRSAALAAFVWVPLATGSCVLEPLAVSSSDQEQTEEGPLDGYVELDVEAREAGWRVRVGGMCFVLDGATPVDVPVEEWVLIERWDGPLYDSQFLYPPPGALLSVSGWDANIALAGGATVEESLAATRSTVVFEAE